jgi:hypothetical protein
VKSLLRGGLFVHNAFLFLSREPLQNRSGGGGVWLLCARVAAARARGGMRSEDFRGHLNRIGRETSPLGGGWGIGNEEAEASQNCVVPLPFCIMCF